MCDRERLVTYLYDELPGADRTAFEAHLASCSVCRSELEAMRDARAQLPAWTPAVPEAGFAMLRHEAATGRWFRPWALAAAAVLVLAVASAAANLQIHTIDGGMVIRTGWSRSAADGGDARASGAATGGQVSSAELEDVRRRMSVIEAALGRRTPATTAVAADGLRPSDADIIRRVRQMVADSELRVKQEVATRIVIGFREMQAAHETDLLRLQQAINQNQGVLNDEVFRQREEMKHFLRLVGNPPQR